MSLHVETTSALLLQQAEADCVNYGCMEKTKKGDPMVPFSHTGPIGSVQDAGQAAELARIAGRKALVVPLSSGPNVFLVNLQP